MENEYCIRVTAGNIVLINLFTCACLPFMAQYFYSCYRLVFGTLYPAYASYKAVKTKNVKEYVKWMMYWIVFALFTCIETFADIFVSFWLPFYYEMKILFVLWLLSPATKGSSILYRRFVHPQLTRREKEIDDYIAKARDQGYATMLQLGSRGLSYATAVVMQTALKGQATLVSHLRKSYSMSDLGQDDRSASQYSSARPRRNTQCDETDSGEESALHQKWVSEGILTDDSEDQQKGFRDESQDPHVGVTQSESAPIFRRTRSVTKAPRNIHGTSHRSVPPGSKQGEVTYATLPRASRARVSKKRTIKPS